MKKILFLIASVLLMTSCLRGPQGPQGPAGPGLNRNIIDVQVASAQWEYSNANNNNYYYAQVNLPELTKNAYDNGNVQVYLVSVVNSKEIQTILPTVRHYEEIQGNDTFYYTQTTDYDYWVGGMEFHITNSDFYYNPDNLNEPGDRWFRIVITY